MESPDDAIATSNSVAAADIHPASDDSKFVVDELQNHLQSLKMIQREYVRVEKEFHRQFYELDTEYQKKRQAVYNRRNALINGMADHRPREPNEIDGEAAHAMQKMQLSESNIEDVNVPGFWLRALKNCIPNLIRDCDEAILSYLSDVKLNMIIEPELSFILEFEFAENPYFENGTLTKQYFLDCDAVEEFNGFSIVRTIGCKIRWKNGMDTTEKETNSFFTFFNPSDANVQSANELEESSVFHELERDFEIGLIFKEKLIPNAVLYYLNEPEEIIDCSTLDECDLTTAESTEL